MGLGEEGLSRNEALPWSLELIERFEDRWDWGEPFATRPCPGPLN